jgi:polyisoprenoid-binding protein YceI
VLDSVGVAGGEVKQGTRVRLKPRAGGDIFDLALASRVAVVEAIEQDYEGNVHLAVVFAEGLFSAFGHDPVFVVRDFEGELQCEHDSLANASARIAIKAQSLSVRDDVKASDRAEIERMMRDEVLEVDKYPEIIFVSNNITASKSSNGRFKAKIIGDLTLHGVTQKNLWIFAEVTVSDDRLQAQGELALKQTDYGIKPVSVAGGTMKVKNEVKLAFDFVAEKE